MKSGPERARRRARCRRARGRTHRSRPTCRRGCGGPPRGRPASRRGPRPRTRTRTARSAGSFSSAGLHDMIRTHGRPDAASAGNADDVVLDDHVRRELVEDLVEPRVDVLRAVDEGLEGRGDELAELLERRLAEDRRRVADEVDPELAGDLGHLGRRAEAHQPLLEPLGLERPGERLLDDEHDAMAARAQDLADPDAVVGRAVGTLGEEDDRPGVGHVALPLRIRRRSSPTGAAIRSVTLQTERYRPIAMARTRATAAPIANAASIQDQRTSR